LEWRSFYTHDLNLPVDICKEVREASIKNRLNRSKTGARVLLLAEEVGSSGHVTGLDSSSESLKYAKEIAKRAGFSGRGQTHTNEIIHAQAGMAYPAEFFEPFPLY